MTDTPARSRPALWTMALAILLAVLAAAIGFRESAHVATGLEGTAGAAFSLPVVTADGPTGARRGLQDARGKPLLLHFWAPSCKPCRAEAPLWQTLHERSRNEGFAVLTVAGDDVADVQAYLTGQALTFPVVHDPFGTAHRAFRVFGIPHTVVLSAAGTVVRELSGTVDAGLVQEALAAANATP